MRYNGTWSRCPRCGSHWPGPCRPHRSSLLILGPAGWSVLDCGSPYALSLVLACPSLSQMARAADSPPAPVSQAAGAPAVRQCQNNLNGIRAISTKCVNQSDNCL